MTAVLKILIRSLLSLAVIFFSLKPSMVNRVDSNLIHPHHIAVGRFVSLHQRTPVSSPFTSLRSSFQKQEDKRQYVAVQAPVLNSEKLFFHAPVALMAAAVQLPRAETLLSSTIILRI